MQLFAGCDWGGEAHAVSVIDEGGAVRWKGTVGHDAEGLAKMVRQLAKLGTPADLPIAIERPTGLLVDTLVEAGHPIVPLHPNVVKACRPRYRAAGGKDDLGDSYMLADILRTDGHRFARLLPQSDAIRALRALVRTRDDLVGERVAMANQLSALLESCWPGAVAIFADIDSPIALAFVRRYPTAASAERLGEKRLASFLAQHSYCGRRTAAELLQRLRAAPLPRIGELEAEAKGQLAAMLASILEQLVAKLLELTARVEHEVAELPEGRIVMSLPRSGRVNAAQILAELGDQRARFDSAEHLAAEAGVVPVTYASGKQRGVVFRWACNHRLRSAITTFADNSRHASPWAAGVYRRARARGCDHPHASRVLARAWVRVLFRMWQAAEPYDPARHPAAAALAATA
ncbi:MAG TPA: IS110 family transposase [Planctomycetota bacterium]|nr:IS110 family transposase [Planctomycetota bacterium]